MAEPHGRCKMMIDNAKHSDFDLNNYPKVSIIMNCFNCSRYLEEAIDSVYAQTYENWEIIFWDNASTDNSAEIAKKHDDKLCYFNSDETVPLGHARNFALGKARGEYIAFLDCDDIWLPDKLEKQIEIFNTNRDVMLVYSDCYIVDSNGNKMRTAFESQKPVRGNIFNELLSRYNFIPLLTAIIKKEVLNEIGLFKDDYKIAADYDLFLRIAYNHPVDYVEDCLAKYRVHDSNLSIIRDIGIKEELEIINKWLHKNPMLNNEIGNKIKMKKLKRYAALYIYYFVKYTHLPKRFAKFY